MKILIESEKNAWVPVSSLEQTFKNLKIDENNNKNSDEKESILKSLLISLFIDGLIEVKQ
jgi:hypothetical protein